MEQSELEKKEAPVTRYVIDCRRHGEREEDIHDREPQLSERGQDQAKAITTLMPPYLTGDAYVSEVYRTKQTAESMKEGEWGEARENIYPEEERIFERRELGGRFFADEQFREEYRRIQKEKGLLSAIQWYLDFDEERPFGNTLSPKEMASSYSKVVLEILNDLKNDNSGKRLPKTVISHDINMEAFLFFTIGDQVMTNTELSGETFMDKIGLISEADGFQLRLEKDREGIKGVLLFKGMTYILDIEELRSLATT